MAILGGADEAVRHIQGGWVSGTICA